ncbi:tRNA methyltransferase 10 homolog A [Arctopsyche grandis]|uniref:tRNA methyltransferase 10 homolog A n=1 Tax=Arctopsyche grandis TaxID=121162 RepID=UPI00406D7CC9
MIDGDISNNNISSEDDEVQLQSKRPKLEEDQISDEPIIQRPFTKNQMRKWLKKEKWEARKNEKRAKEKARAKQRRVEAKINNIDIGPSRKALKHSKVANSTCTTGIVIDLSFDHLMIEKDRAKVIKQILRCYSLNRRSSAPMKFVVCNFSGRTKAEMSRHNGYEYWDVTFEEKNYLDVFPPEDLVYLSSESENVIQNIEPNKMYIIGGLVDHNSHKGLCHKIAVEQGIQHGRLPLDDYLNMKTRKVLTIDHVFEILLRITEGVPWTETLMRVVPMRKGASVSAEKTNTDDSKYSDSCEESN